MSVVSGPNHEIEWSVDILVVSWRILVWNFSHDFFVASGIVIVSVDDEWLIGHSGNINEHVGCVGVGAVAGS